MSVWVWVLKKGVAGACLEHFLCVCEVGSRVLRYICFGRRNELNKCYALLYIRGWTSIRWNVKGHSFIPSFLPLDTIFIFQFGGYNQVR